MLSYVRYLEHITVLHLIDDAASRQTSICQISQIVNFAHQTKLSAEHKISRFFISGIPPCDRHVFTEDLLGSYITEQILASKPLAMQQGQQMN
jgi:hypothetical protein